MAKKPKPKPPPKVEPEELIPGKPKPQKLDPNVDNSYILPSRDLLEDPWNGHNITGGKVPKRDVE